MSRGPAFALLVALILAGFALRLHRLDHFSFRGDEAFTVLNWVSRPLAETLQGDIPLKDPQPPLTFALFRAWALLFGTGEFVMRLLPALLGLVGIPAMYALAHRIGGRGRGLLAATLWVLHPFLIWHAQDAKPYAIWAALSVCAAWLALRALQRGRALDWLLYIAAVTLAASLYYLELFQLAALNLFVLAAYRKQGRVLRRWLMAQLLIALLLAPWYLQERLLFSSGYAGTTGGFEPLRLFTWLLPALQFGRSLPEATLARSALLVCFALAAGLWLLARRNRRLALYAGLSASLPPLLLSLAALRLGVFTPRYVLACIPASILLLVELVCGLWRRSLSARLLAVAVSGTWLALMLLSLGNAWFDPSFAKSPDWRGLARYLAREATASDLVIQAAADEAFTLYHADTTDSLRLPANPLQDEAEILGALESAVAGHDSVWLVANSPPTWPNRDVATDWLGANLQLIRATQIGALPVRQYRTWRVRQSELAAQPLATFTGIAALVGMNQGRTPDALLVELIWRALGPAETPLKAFVHLYCGPQPETLRTQDDQFLQDGRVDARSWTHGMLLRDVYELPLDAGELPGDCVLRVGLYDPASGARVPLPDGEDSVAAGRIQRPLPA